MCLRHTKLYITFSFKLEEEMGEIVFSLNFEKLIVRKFPQILLIPSNNSNKDIMILLRNYFDYDDNCFDKKKPST